MNTFKGMRALCLLGLSAGFARCTPPHQDGGAVEWMVANHTSDTLLLLVRWPLDSIRVPPAALPRLRRELASDSTFSLARKYPLHPLQRLTKHQAQWYWIANPGWTNPLNDAPPSRAAVTKLAGMLTYKISPHGKQLVARGACLPCNSVPRVPIVSLDLQQGPASRRRLLGNSPGGFRAVPATGTHTYRYQLTVGPGLTINP